MLGVADSWYKVNGYAGDTWSWCPSDSQDRFERNILDPEKREKIEEAGWTRDNISYTFNAHGFRSEEFIESDSVMFLGCSLTMGVGVDLESSWAYKVANSLGLRRYNLGVGGGCIDMCFRFAHYWIPRLRPKYVVMLTPSAGRLEILTDRENILYLPNMVYDDLFYQRWLMNDVNGDMNRLKNQIAIRYICEQHDAKLFEITVEDTMAKRTVLGPNTWGRDVLHPGREWNESMAHDFLSMMA